MATTIERILSKDVINLLMYAPLIIANLLWCWMRMALPRWLCPTKDLSNEVVLITGAGSGLGRAIALQFAKLGSSIVAWDINMDGLEKTRQMVEEIHSEFEQKQRKNFQNTNNNNITINKRICLTYRVDVSDCRAVNEAAACVKNDLKNGNNNHKCTNKNTTHSEERYVSILVNNAGIYHGLMLHELREDQIERIFKINVLSHFWTVRAFLNDMVRNKRGHLVEIASMAGISGLQKQVDYCSSKFANIGFEDALHMELESLNLSQFINSTVVCPFFFSSNLFTDYKSTLNALMTADYVAIETVEAIKRNQSMIMLPARAYLNYLLKSLLPRETFVLCTKAMGYSECVRDIKGAAASN